MRKINKGDWIVITTKDPNVKDAVTEMKKIRWCSITVTRT